MLQILLRIQLLIVMMILLILDYVVIYPMSSSLPHFFVNAIQLDKLRPEEIAIMQFDSRPLGDYWLAAAKWNKFYCDRHGHRFLYFTIPPLVTLPEDTSVSDKDKKKNSRKRKERMQQQQK